MLVVDFSCIVGTPTSRYPDPDPRLPTADGFEDILQFYTIRNKLLKIVCGCGWGPRTGSLIAFETPRQRYSVRERQYLVAVSLSLSVIDDLALPCELSAKHVKCICQFVLGRFFI